ncbi:CLUMA_CG005994, isoform A [Clunio marinus]|uniref:CLUMA_CG005994, isoform A n=1 Tax=Clunio marinus TaxID=568069 RepID=A0A1J1HWN0_9DIPT|nr:CLUMA_CG005994, isoform A [Clunio marinus]
MQTEKESHLNCQNRKRKFFHIFINNQTHIPTLSKCLLATREEVHGKYTRPETEITSQKSTKFVIGNVTLNWDKEYF